MNKRLVLFLAALAVAGCHNDAKPPTDGDNGAPPDPKPVHVGASGLTAGLQASGKRAAYLLNPFLATKGAAPIGTAGDLHVTSSDGKDVLVAANVLLGEYLLAPDGGSIFWVGFDLPGGTTTGAASLNFLSLTTDGAKPVVISAKNAPVVSGGAMFTPFPIAELSLYSPSSKFFATALAPTTDATPDLHVYETAGGTEVFQRVNGTGIYSRAILPDDTLVFQDTVNGTGPAAPPLQTLFWVKLGGSNATPATLTTRAAQFTTTADNKTLVVLRTNGDIVTWASGSSGMVGAPVATGAASMTLGTDGNGPVAWVGADQSLHVMTTDGAKKLDLDAATAKADVLGTVILSPDGKDLYYWQNVEQQSQRGNLFHVAVAGGTPVKVAEAVSLVDVAVTPTAVLLLQGVDLPGQLGNAAWAQLDGSKVTPLGTGATVGGLRAAAPSSGGWRALHLNGAMIDTDMKHTPINGAPAIVGSLVFDDDKTAGTVLDASVHTGVFDFSLSGDTAVYAGGAAWNDSAQDWVGALTFIDGKTPTKKVDGKVAGVSEIGPIANRQLFVNAPLANPNGIYFITY